MMMSHTDSSELQQKIKTTHVLIKTIFISNKVRKSTKKRCCGLCGHMTARWAGTRVCLPSVAMTTESLNIYFVCCDSQKTSRFTLTLPSLSSKSSPVRAASRDTMLSQPEFTATSYAVRPLAFLRPTLAFKLKT